MVQSPGRIALSVDVTNTGARTGTEVVQVYVRPHAPRVPRPDRELAAFAKVTLDAGESRAVAFELHDAAFSYWDTASHGWVCDAGHYTLLIGSSSRDIRRQVEVARP